MAKNTCSLQMWSHSQRHCSPCHWILHLLLCQGMSFPSPLTPCFAPTCHITPSLVGLGSGHYLVTAPVCTHQPALLQPWSALPRECGHLTDLWQIPWKKRSCRNCVTVGPATLSSWSGSGWTWPRAQVVRRWGRQRQQWLLWREQPVWEPGPRDPCLFL